MAAASWNTREWPQCSCRLPASSSLDVCSTRPLAPVATAGGRRQLGSGAVWSFPPRAEPDSIINHSDRSHKVFDGP